MVHFDPEKFFIRPWIMQLRLATSDDLPILAELYSYTVRKMGPALYTEDQVRVWSASPDDAERFRGFVMNAHTLVAMVPESPTPVGFAGLEPNGRIASLYVHADYCRRGIGSALLTAILEQAATEGLTRLRTEASKFSRPVFERFGFTLDEVERGVHHGVPFMRFLMSRGKKLSDEELLNRIVSDPNVLVGKPVIKGTRLSVEFILNLLAHGTTADEILAEYPGLELDDIRACQQF